MIYCPECTSPLQYRLLDGVERKACTSSTCHFVHWENPIPVVAVLVYYLDKIVLARNAQWPSERFSVITGYLERDETPEQAVVREVREELGLEAQIGEFIGHYSIFRMNQLILAFSVVATGVLTLGSELVEYRLLTKEQLKKYDFGELAITGEIAQAWLRK